MDAIFIEGSSMTDNYGRDNITYFDLDYDQITTDVIISLAQARVNLVMASHWKMVHSICNYVCFVLCFCGIVFNVATITIHKKLGFKDYSDVLIFSMAVADVILLLTYFVDHITVIVKDFDITWYNYLVLTYMNIFYPWRYQAYSYSICLMALLSAERIIAVIFPFPVSKILTPKKLTLVIGLLLLHVVIFTFPNLYLFFDYEVRKNKYQLIPTVLLMVVPIATMKHVELLCSVLIFYIPWLIILLSINAMCASVPILYYKISRRKNYKTDLKNICHFKLLLCLYFVKFFTLIPAALALINELFQLYSKLIMVNLGLVLQFLKFFNIIFASCSFCVCLTLNTKFAAAFKRLLKLQK